MGLYLGYVINLVITFVAAAAVFAFWVANRKRIAAETVGRAEEQALRTLKDAERDADSRKKEALLEAKEKAHELRTEAERVARDKTQHLTDLEQQLHRREQTLTDKLTNVDRKEKDLQAHGQTIADKEKAATAAAVEILAGTVFYLTGRMPLAYAVFIWLAALFVIYLHRSNIQRLLAGTESRFGKLW